jgi:5-methylcytosine-specific restriction enzyme B
MLLEKKIVEQIESVQERLKEQGRLPAQDRLKAYYDLFRSKFGPEVLRLLDGEDLLDLVHNHGNHESLVYWLEFKNDEEFPQIFGSISGGSAFKFKLYKGKDTGE